MSEPADPTGGPPVPPGTDLKAVAGTLANGVCAAYAAYNNGNNLISKLPDYMPGYTSFTPIYVWQTDPNVIPWSLTAAARAKVAAVTSAEKRVSVRREPAAYAPSDSPSPCTGPQPLGTRSLGRQLFGFTATSNDNRTNILALRGTVTMEEAGYDLFGWGTKTACRLPSQGSEQQSLGMVNADLFDFYIYDNFGAVTSLATSCMNAIAAASAQAPNAQWLFGSHSLGGAMLSLAALDAVVSNLIASQNLIAMTFGSLHVGDRHFAQYYEGRVPWSYSVANLCDFVPSMVSIEPVRPTDPYVHVGSPGTFMWQTWDDWGNHHLPSIYMKIVEKHWDVIKWGERDYPQ